MSNLAFLLVRFGEMRAINSQETKQTTSIICRNMEIHNEQNLYFYTPDRSNGSRRLCRNQRAIGMDAASNVSTRRIAYTA